MCRNGPYLMRARPCSSLSTSPLAIMPVLGPPSSRSAFLIKSALKTAQSSSAVVWPSVVDEISTILPFDAPAADQRFCPPALAHVPSFTTDVEELTTFVVELPSAEGVVVVTNVGRALSAP